jgi:hypothetical protein
MSMDFEDETAQESEHPVLLTAHYSVEDLGVNTVEDERFAFTPPPGTVIYHRDRNETEVLPGGRELLDEHIDIAAQAMPPTAVALVLFRSKSGPLIVGIGILIVLNVGLYCLSRPR